jgi:hypothetical protein
MESTFVKNAKLMGIVFAAAVGIAGCDSSTGPVEVHVRTNVTEYPPAGSIGQRSVAVTGTLSNEDSKSVWLDYCGVAIQRRSSSGWITVWQESCAGVDGSPTEVEPGESILFGIELFEKPGSISYRPAFQFDVCNEHRVLLPLTDDGQYTDKTKPIIAPSNSFGFGGLCS